MNREKWVNLLVTSILFVIPLCLVILMLTGLFTIVMAVIHWLHR